MYYRYMDDTFVVFSNEDECDFFLDSLNSLHPSLRFTFENESNLAPVAYAGFLKGGGRKFENNEDQKKFLHSESIHFSAQN